MDRKNLLVSYANMAHSFGFVPIPLKNKIPITSGWPNFRNNSIEDIRDIDCGKLPKNVRRVKHLLDAGVANNIGIITGEASNVVVLDIDSQNKGVEKWLEMMKLNEEIPQTFTVKTGEGGYHYYFEYGPDLINFNNRNKILGFSFDFRTNGGMVVFPGSVGSSGNEYQVYDGYIDNKIIIAEMPIWIKKLLLMDHIKKDLKIEPTLDLVNTQAAKLNVMLF